MTTEVGRCEEHDAPREGGKLRRGGSHGAGVFVTVSRETVKEGREAELRETIL